MRPPLRPTRPRAGFTLIELLVVIVIIGLISAVALPVVLPALNERRVSEGARLVQAVLAGTRDAAIRANAPRGVRLLPDPLFGFVASASGGQPLAANRFIPIEPAPDYSEGLVTGGIVPASSDATTPTPILSDMGTQAQYLRVVASEYSSSTPAVPQDPTGWQFNIRQGDKIRFNDSGAYYTVAGPIHKKINSGDTTQSVSYNPERFICYETTANETFPFRDPSSLIYQSGGAYLPLEYLELTNGIDDDGDGWIDEACDGIDNDGDGIIDPGFNGVDDNGNGIIDDPAELLIGLNSSGTQTATAGSEYEEEKFVGVQTSVPPQNSAYTIIRRPVVSPNAVETTLPEGVVIDLTTWNAGAAVDSTGKAAPSLPERSRLPVDPFAGYVDIMIDQTGRVVPPGAGSGSGAYNASSPLATLPFYHFWLAEREGLVPPMFGTVAIAAKNGGYQVPIANPSHASTTAPLTYLLPMPQGVGTVDANSQPVTLKGQRRLVTLFTKTGQIVTNSIENFNLNDTSAPYYDAQNGTKESL